MTYSLSLKKLNLQVLQMATQYMWQSRFDRNFTIRIWFKTNDMIVNPDKFRPMSNKFQSISSKKGLRKSVLNINGYI